MAPTVTMPAKTVDGNSPAFRDEHGILHVYTSTGAQPERMSGPSVTELSLDTAPVVEPADHYPIWIESVWRDEDGTVYGWYHHEPDAKSICGDRGLTAPKIGAVVSHDGGQTFRDLGLVLTSGDQPNCSAENGFFAGGHGDFSVILDRERTFFYFLFTNYAGSAHQQGVAIARMPFADRAEPVGKVHKYFLGEWSEPGVGGMMTPIFAANRSWDHEDTDSYWGPAIHWNTSAQSYVMVMNHACCSENWPQEGIYITFNADLAHPEDFTTPMKLIDDAEIGFSPGYYPQIFGAGEGETDSLAGREARLFIKGVSNWALTFLSPEESEAAAPPEDNPIDCSNAECTIDSDNAFGSGRRLQASPARKKQ